MSSPKDSLVLILSLVVTGGLVGGGLWFFSQGAKPSLSPVTQTPTTLLSPPPTPGLARELPAPSQVATGTTIKIDGSTSMAAINAVLKRLFTKTFPGTQVINQAQGSDQGLVALQKGEIDLAALSRPLTVPEQSQGLVAVPVARDSIAIVVGQDNPFRQSLTHRQVMDIFQGKVQNWSQVGGPQIPIQVINRPAVSGTHQFFKAMVLEGGDFGQTPNVKTLTRDATTPMLRELGKGGIGYATASQVSDQSTVRVLPIDGILPTNPQYPFRRELFYVYKNPISAEAQAFLGFAISPQGQAAIALVE
jgi:phosphate transport system substrate-binding protein